MTHLSILDWWLLLAIASAAAAAGAFIVRYWVSMTWEKTATGRAIMGLTTAVFAAVVAAGVRRVDELAPAWDGGPWPTVLAAVAWTGIAAGFAWQHWALGKHSRQLQDEINTFSGKQEVMNTIDVAPTLVDTPVPDVTAVSDDELLAQDTPIPAEFLGDYAGAAVDEVGD